MGGGVGVGVGREVGVGVGRGVLDCFLLITTSLLQYAVDYKAFSCGRVLVGRNMGMDRGVSWGGRCGHRPTKVYGVGRECVRCGGGDE